MDSLDRLLDFRAQDCSLRRSNRRPWTGRWDLHCLRCGREKTVFLPLNPPSMSFPRVRRPRSWVQKSGMRLSLGKGAIKASLMDDFALLKTYLAVNFV